MKKLIGLIGLCLISAPIFAQFSAPGLDGKQYTPQNTQTNKKSSNDGPHDFNNTIFLNLTHTVRGIGSLGYQRIIGKHYGIKGSLGYCFAIDPTSFFIYEDELTNYYNTKALPTYMMEDAKLQQGIHNLYGELTFKYFSRLREADYGDVSGRWFVGLDYRKYNYNLSMSNSYSTNSAEPLPVTTIVKQQAYHLLAGINVYRPGGYSWEMYTGLGICQRNAPNFTRGEFQTYYTPDANNTRYNTLQLVMGWNIGFSF
ncbi:MAG: hypothetical protein ACR2IL_03610 [Chitinophagaceae bacterium]